jgi:hypothetical protein
VRDGPRLCLILVSTLALSGCMTFGAVERRSTSINEGVGASGNRAVLLNLVRASRAEPLYFMSLTTLHATATGDLKVGLPQGTLGPVDFPVRVAQNYTFGTNASNTLDNNTSTSFDMGVLGSKEFYAGLLAPLGVADVDLLLHQGFSRELVFDLVIDHAKITEVAADNDHHPTGPPYVVYNDPTDRNFQNVPFGFQYYIEQAVIHGLTTETIAPSGEGGAKEKPDAAAGIPELLGAVANALNKKPSSPKVALCYEPALATGPAQADLADSKSICGRTGEHQASDQASAPLFVKLTIGGQMHYLEIEVTTRSIFGVFNYLGQMIANRDEDAVRLHQYTSERSNTDPILDLTAGGADFGGCFTAVSYAGGHYCVPQKGAENTKRVFAILNMLIALKQSPGDLPITQTVRIEQ